MSASFAIPEDLLRRQREASDPALSAWVSANAGSGKTYVLAQRVIRLLLSGTPPGKILCLTFTKAAAGNMAASVAETLARWTALEDGSLDDAIHAMSNERPSPSRRAAARRLFAQAIETPGGLKVQTIHAFCTRLLQQFPFEANVPARFAVLDEAAEQQLIEELTLDVLLAGSAQAEGALGRALATVVANASDFTFREVLSEAIGKRLELAQWVAQAGGIEAALAELTAMLGLEADETVRSIEAQLFDGEVIAPTQWAAVAEALAQGSDGDRMQSARFARLPRIAAAERIEAYLSIFCTNAGEPRQRLVSAAIAAREPGWFARLCAERERVRKLLTRRRAATTRDRTGALLTIAMAVIERYRAQKGRRGLLDYDDLIEKSRELLTRVDAAWVHYKLDLGIDHVLIDEAQDTSPRQWDVIERLIAEFAVGNSARTPLNRTLFAVGDDKQSIFSFQGALPAAFGEKRGNFQRAYQAAGLCFLPIEFKYSFRSAQTVLDAVDRVFQQPGALRGLADAVPIVHTAVRAAPGLVEIWPLIEPAKTAAVEGWDAPFDATSQTSPRVELARAIAQAVGGSIARGTRVGDGPNRHAVTPGDFLILVRQRGPLFEAIIQALKNAGIAVAGADRLVLTEHIAVMDLLALADAVLLPQDDLALATVLKSPLFGLDEEELFALAHGRRGSLHAALQAQAPANEALTDAAARFARLAAAARHETPFAFYARTLGPEGARKRFLARLGPEAADALDELLNIALDYERRETPSLQGFVAWLRSANAEIKRDMEISRDEVRVMTVHGAKGLEAPIVILADTTTVPAGPPQRQPRLLPLAAAGAPTDRPRAWVWSGPRKDDVPLVATARQAAAEAAENEHRRLLYVAMTRAADRLIICGATGERGKPAGCWYDLVHGALVESAIVEPADDATGTLWRLRGGSFESAAARDFSGTARLPPAELRPAWLDAPAPPDALPTRSLAPSSAEADRAFAPAGTGGGTERRKALARGELMHRLLQALPGIAAPRRAEIARHHIARSGAEFSAAERDAMVERVLLIIEDKRFSSLFGPHSRAEVPIVGRIVAAGRTLTVAGQIDRLAVTDRVLIADYKTNRPAPRRVEDVPPAYLAQLALYRAVISHLYPDRPLRAALIWTDVPDLMEISAPALDRALAALAASPSLGAPLP